MKFTATEYTALYYGYYYIVKKITNKGWSVMRCAEEDLGIMNMYSVYTKDGWNSIMTDRNARYFGSFDEVLESEIYKEK